MRRVGLRILPQRQRGQAQRIQAVCRSLATSPAESSTTPPAPTTTTVRGPAPARDGPRVGGDGPPAPSPGTVLETLNARLRPDGLSPDLKLWYAAKRRLLAQFPEDARKFLKTGNSRQGFFHLNNVRQDLQLLRKLCEQRGQKEATIMNPFLGMVNELIDTTLANEIQRKNLKLISKPHATIQSARMLLDTIHTAVHTIITDKLWIPESLRHYKTLIKLSDGKNAERYLNLLWGLQHNRPDRFDYTVVLEKYCDEQNPQACTRIIQNWRKRYHEANKHPTLKPTERGYNCWLKSLSCRQINPEAEAKEAEVALHDIRDRQAVDDYTVGAPLYNEVIHAYAKARNPEAAERIFYELCENAQTNKLCEPNAISFSSVIDAWSKSLRPDAPQRAVKLVQAMEHYKSEKPLITAVTLTSLIECWARSMQPNAPYQADAILNKMKTLAATTQPEVRPNMITFNMCMKAWERSGLEQAGDRIEELFREAKSYHCEPDALSYLLRFSAWEMLRQRDPLKAALHCIKALEEMISQVSVYPDRRHFNRVLKVLAEAGAHKQADQVLQHMLNDYQKKKIEASAPSRVSFSHVMHAWLKNGTAEAAIRCEEILYTMHELYQKENQDLKPVLEKYNVCLAAWAKSGAPDSYTRAAALMETMKQHGMTPDVYSYTNLLKCLARGKSDAKAEVAKDIINEIESMKIQPNEYIRVVRSKGILFSTRPDNESDDDSI